MKRSLWLLVLLALPLCARPVQAQIIFKKARTTPAQRVPELILTLKTESDERKRAHAAEELREYDAKAFTEIVPVLIDVLHNDKKANVRLEALNSLARLRPVSPAAGQAIEHAAASDESLRVRLQAKSALLKYHLAGYGGSGKNEPPVYQQPTTQEPPLAEPSANPPTMVPAVSFPPVSVPKGGPPVFGPIQTTPKGSAAPPTFDMPRPLPQGVALPPGQMPEAPAVIQLEGPALPPRPF